MAVSSAHITLEEFLKLPENKPGLEYIDGAVSQKMSPKARHSKLQTELAVHLRRSGLQHELADAFTELRATFSGSSVVPDVSVYRWQRIPLDSHGELEEEVLAPPDIAVEILSPGQSVTRLVQRCLWYVANGVQIALLVNPSDRSIFAFRPGAEAAELHGSDRIDLSEVLPDFDLTVEQLFASFRYR